MPGSRTVTDNNVSLPNDGSVPEISRNKNRIHHPESTMTYGVMTYGVDAIPVGWVEAIAHRERISLACGADLGLQSQHAVILKAQDQWNGSTRDQLWLNAVQVNVGLGRPEVDRGSGG